MIIEVDQWKVLQIKLKNSKIKILVQYNEYQARFIREVVNTYITLNKNDDDPSNFVSVLLKNGIKARNLDPDLKVY